MIDVICSCRQKPPAELLAGVADEAATSKAQQDKNNEIYIQVAKGNLKLCTLVK